MLGRNYGLWKAPRRSLNTELKYYSNYMTQIRNIYCLLALKEKKTKTEVKKLLKAIEAAATGWEKSQSLRLISFIYSFILISIMCN